MPSLAVTTSYPRGTSTASSSRTFSGTSSTTRILACRSATVAVLLDGVDQLCDVDRLGEVAVEAGLEESLPVSAHRLRGQRQHGDRGRLLGPSQPRECLDAVDAR